MIVQLRVLRHFCDKYISDLQEKGNKNLADYFNMLIHYLSSNV